MDGPDVEDRRRERNAQRRVLQRRARREAYLAAIRERDPALAEELEALRRFDPQGYRKAVQRAARALGLHRPFVYSERARSEA